MIVPPKIYAHVLFRHMLTSDNIGHSFVISSKLLAAAITGWRQVVTRPITATCGDEHRVVLNHRTRWMNGASVPVDDGRPYPGDDRRCTSRVDEASSRGREAIQMDDASGHSHLTPRFEAAEIRCDWSRRSRQQQRWTPPPTDGSTLCALLGCTFWLFVVENEHRYDFMNIISVFDLLKLRHRFRWS